MLIFAPCFKIKLVSIQKKAHETLIFRKWNRKSYSLFMVLKKEVIIAALSVVYLLSTPVIAEANEQDTTGVKMEYDLDEIEVSAQRSPALYSQVARIISVIERKEIEAAPAQSVQDLLEYVAGVDVRQRGTEGVQADISIRGGTFDQILVLLNGINITDPQTGHHNLNLPVSLAQIERIEVLEGPAARVYGPNAFSGAINIVTRQPNENVIDLSAEAGSYGYFQPNVSLSFADQKWKHSLGLGGKRSDGYTDNTDFTELNGFYSGQYRSSGGTTQVQLGASKKGFGANSFYSPKYPNQYEATKTLFSSIRYESNGKFHLTPAVYYRRHQDRFELFRSDPASWYTGHNYHLTNVYGANLNSWTNWSLGKTALGIEFRSENILSNVLGKELDEPKKVPGEDAEFTKSDSRNTVSLFLEHSIYVDRWTFSGGILTNTISGSGLGINVFPGLDISYQPTENYKLFATYNTSLRMPTFTDLYYKGPTNIGNPDLKPERSETLEAGLKLQHSIVRGHFLVFYRQGHDIIDWVKENAEDIWQPQNLTELKSLGAEVQVDVLLSRKFGNYCPDVRTSYLFNNVSKSEEEFISRYVLDNLRHKWVTSVNQQILPNLSLNVEAVSQDREGGYVKYEDTVPVGETDYVPFWLFDTKLTYHQKRFSAFVSVNNIFNTEYNDIDNVIQPGRWFKAGLSYRIPY